jgi:hypothetical protein
VVVPASAGASGAGPESADPGSARRRLRRPPAAAAGWPLPPSPRSWSLAPDSLASCPALAAGPDPFSEAALPAVAPGDSVLPRAVLAWAVLPWTVLPWAEPELSWAEPEPPCTGLLAPELNWAELT